MKKLLSDIRACRLCEGKLPLGPRPIVRLHPDARILIIGQAPGTKVHVSSIPWADASGKELRRWLNVDEDRFYDESLFAIMPMGFCYPGKGSSGDLPPRPECAPQWHNSILKHLKKVRLTLLIGSYAQGYYLKEQSKSSLTETVRAFGSYLPDYFPLPHPSPRNRLWQSRNPWFEKQLIPQLQKRVHQII